MTREERDMEWWTSVYSRYAAHGLPSDLCKEHADKALAALRGAFPVSRAAFLVTAPTFKVGDVVDVLLDKGPPIYWKRGKVEAVASNGWIHAKTYDGELLTRSPADVRPGD